jgi:hypothetical protein
VNGLSREVSRSVAAAGQRRPGLTLAAVVALHRVDIALGRLLCLIDHRVRLGARRHAVAGDVALLLASRRRKAPQR